MTSEYKFGNIIRPRSRFMDQLGTIWSCHEKNSHSVTFYRCSDSAGELEPVPTMAVPYKGMTDGEVMEANGLQPLLIPEEMLICDCQFGVADQSFTCHECHDLGLIHYHSFLGGVIHRTWRHLLGPETTPESVERALIYTIALDLYWADFYSKIQGTLSEPYYLMKAQSEWDRMTTKIELGYGFDGTMTGKEWHALSGDPLPGDPLYDEWVAFNTPDDADRDPYDDCPGIPVMASAQEVKLSKAESEYAAEHCIPYAEMQDATPQTEGEWAEMTPEALDFIAKGYKMSGEDNPYFKDSNGDRLINY